MGLVFGRAVQGALNHRGFLFRRNLPWATGARSIFQNAGQPLLLISASLTPSAIAIERATGSSVSAIILAITQWNCVHLARSARRGPHVSRIGPPHFHDEA